MKPPKEPDNPAKAFAYAIWLLGRREYSAAEMRTRMTRKGYEPPCVEEAMARLLDGGYVSDARFAESFVRMRLRRGETPRLAAAMARRRGADEAAVDAVLTAAERGFDADAACREIVERRDPQGLRFKERKVWARHFRYLKSKGFDSSVAVDALNRRHVTED